MLQELSLKLQEAVRSAEQTNARLVKKDLSQLEKENFLNQRELELDLRDKKTQAREEAVAGVEDILKIRDNNALVSKKNEDDTNKLNDERLAFNQFELEERNNIEKEKNSNKAEADRLAGVAKKLEEDKLHYKEQVLKELSINITVPK